LKKLKLYGRKVYVQKPDAKSFDKKWDQRADKGILLGYESLGYRVLLNGKIVIAWHVEVAEKKRN